MSRMPKAMADSSSQQLQGLSGQEFDRACIDNEVMLHRHVLTDLDGSLIPSAQNAELRQLLQTIRTSVESQLQQAQQIRSALGQAQAGTAGQTGQTQRPR